MSDFLSSIVKTSGNKFASLVSEGLQGSDVHGFVDTGCYLFNGLLSGGIYLGLPNNKILALAGESSTGKTYFTLGIVSKFLKVFISEHSPKKIISYADRRFTYIHKNIYSSIGMKLSHISPPNYWYFKNGS